MKDEKGFANLEVILALMIVSMLILVAVPKFARTVDKLTLDSEMKKFATLATYSVTRDNSLTFTPSVFKYKLSFQMAKLSIKTLPKQRKYFLANGDKVVGDTYALPKGFSVTDKAGNSSRTVTFTSRFGYKAQIIHDSVGRWRGNRNGK